MVQYAGCDVRRTVGVKLIFFDRVGQVVLMPATVIVLFVSQPLVGPFGLVDTPDGGQGHGGLGVVPRISMATFEPRNHSVGKLAGGDGFRGNC